MALDYSDVVKQAYVKMKSKKMGVWQRRWIVLSKPSSKGPRRIEKYTDEKLANIGAVPQKIIELNSVKSISRLPEDIKKSAVAICFFDGSSRQFACDTDPEADDWVEALVHECLMNTDPLVSNVDLLSSGTTQREMYERFHVFLLPSPNLKTCGECLMQITAENIYLLDADDPNKRLLTWPLSSLRRYGRDESKFTFEAGRYCDSGEGMFVFNTTDGERIYKKVHQSTLAIAEAHRLMNRQFLRNQMAGDLLNSLPVSPNRAPLIQARSLPLSPLADSSPSGVHTPLHHTSSSPAVSPIRSTKSAVNPGRAPAPPPRPSMMASRPLPDIPDDEDDEDDDLEDYIYEEKGLHPDFRKFLKARKDDPT